MLLSNWFANADLVSLIDVLVVATAIYVVLLFIQQTKSFFIFSAIAVLLGANYLATLFNLRLTQELFEPLLTFFLVIFVVVFQKEIRRFFEWLTWPGHRRLWPGRRPSRDSDLPQLLATAASECARRKIGALIVLAGREAWEQIVQGGFPLEGKISAPLLLSIFDPTSPGHDGAVIIEDGRLKIFGAHLPLAENFKQFEKMGTRHRAALGMSERTDALVLVVSEERGIISLAQGGELKELSDSAEIEQRLGAFLGLDQARAVAPWQYFLTHNMGLKLVSLFLALIFWLASN